MWTSLVDAKELLARSSDPNVRIVDVRHRLMEPEWGIKTYGEGHLPGAVFAHIDRDLSSKVRPTTGRHPLPDPKQFRAWCGHAGIGPATQVVCYDDQGGMWAARLWWLLKDYGHEAVAVLDGGSEAWTRAGGKLTTDHPQFAPTAFHGEPGHRPRAEAKDILDAAKERRFRLLDARAPERFRGETEPVDAVAGHIPGAQNLAAASLVGQETRFIDRRVLRNRLKLAAQDTKPEDIVAYCGSGVTACHIVLAFEAAGLGSIRLYPGSWSEWIRDRDRPVAKGP